MSSKKHASYFQNHPGFKFIGIATLQLLLKRSSDGSVRLAGLSQKSYLQRLFPISQWQICKLNAPKIQALLQTIPVSSGPLVCFFFFQCDFPYLEMKIVDI